MHPILFSFGPVHLYSFGVLVAIGVLCAVLLLKANARRVSIQPDTVVDLAIATVVGGFIGARLFYVVQYWDFFLQSPLDIIKIWEGGIVLYGGLIGGLLGFSIFVRLKRLPFLVSLDLFVPALALAQGFGRIGCFLNGCCFGEVTEVPWSVQFPFLDYRVHPTQLYEAIFCFLLATFLLFLWRKHLRAGAVAAAYFILYPMGRFLFEFFRGDNAKSFLNFTLHQWISIALIVSTLIVLFTIRLGCHGKKTTHRSA